MIYNELGSSGLKVSALSFGSMRWANEEDCSEIIHRGMDRGMNYVDTSTGYIGGKSQVWVANAIRHRRGEILFSSKSFWATSQTADKAYARLVETLETLGLDYFDLYQIWGIGSVRMVKDATKKGGTLEGLRKAEGEGLIRRGIGFTFHGPPKAFRAAVDTGEFVSATVSYNLSNREEQEQIAYAAERGVGVILMNPLAGGPLAKPSDRRLDFLRREGTGPVYGALRFLLANKNVATSLIGLATPDQVDEDLRALESPEELTEEFRQTLIRRMDDKKFTKAKVCTGCGYCRDCPQGFDPTRFMELVRDHAMYAATGEKRADWLERHYAAVGTSLAAELGKCTECGQCQEKCPQKLPIAEEIRRAKEVLR